MKYHVLTLVLVLNFFISPLTFAQDVELQAQTPELVLQDAPPDQTFTFVNSEFGKEKLSDKQQELLLKAYNIAIEDGHKEPAILPAVVFQETRAGKVVNYLRKRIQKITAKYRQECFGISQIKLAAAKEVLKRYPDLSTKYLSKSSDVDIVNALIVDDEFNMRVASKYLLIMEEFGGKRGKSVQWKAAAYNRGPGGAKGHNVSQLRYVKLVESHIHKFKSNIRS